MKNVFKIFFRDLKTLTKNRAALLIILGLCILPSLYAWINIKACWDPYANTGNLPVAIVNNDEGAVLNNKNINAGDNIVSELKKNKSIGWVFVDEWQGNYGLNEGKYYALIEIPSDFTKDLLTLTTVTLKKPNIIYRNNEKLNAIASKITNVAKEKLAQNVKEEFVAAVNEEAFKQLNLYGGKLKINKNQVLELRDTMNEAYNNLGEIRKYISEANTSSESLQNFLQTSKSKLPEITDQINNLQKVTDASKDLNIATKEIVNTAAYDLNNDMVKLQSLNQQVQSLLASIKQNSKDPAIATPQLDNGINLCEQLNKLLDSDIEKLQVLDKLIPNNYITDLISSLKSVKSKVTIEESKIQDLKALITSGTPEVSINNAIDSVVNASNDTTSGITNSSSKLYNNVLPALNSLSDTLNSDLDNANSLLEATKVIVPQLNAIENFSIVSSEISVQEANQLSNQLASFQAELVDVMNKTKDINEQNIDKIIKIMLMDPSKVASFLSSPIDVKEVEVYNTDIFGIGLTPFYTVLAIWVGALLTSALLSIDAGELKNGVKPSLSEEHFGKMLFFIMISIIQSVIVTFGDIYILRVDAANKWLMLGFAIISGVTFTIIIFTLVSIFGNVGKAIAVVIMVFQIAGSGGIYPIQTNPKIFGVLQPIWPFTYAINGFREAISGPLWTSVHKNIIGLSIFAIVFIFLVVLKKPFHNVTRKMKHKFEEAGL